ncbi:GntR family transcriptional regulator [Ciceribacter sp. L1K23]|uniref:GntR family transcriptional regulator n=1 Tax=Ciceribacter sp. L1K23 TaxID=2820276 RepID=UPI001B82968B|nr:GntR family transcriptional regulator [Ciceribacter sp. L1K23]MBR0557500.1 GntR family transcriptional regulator [Ciceribacter sp. L1K23]
MATDQRRPHHRHVELAQKVLDIAIERGMSPGERLAEQAIASLCNVSRTPVRKAFQILADRGLLTADSEGGYVLAADPVAITRLDDAEGREAEADLSGAILRDLAAGRIPEIQTVAALQRRYAVSRLAVQNALIKLSEDNLAERGAGQQWVLKQFAVSAEAAVKSYEYRLVMEPMALTLPDFKRDTSALMSLRQSMLLLKGMDEFNFDRRLFERTDLDFHMLVARGCGNPFVAEALASHHRRRRALPQVVHINNYRLMQSNIEHMQILEQIERGQMELAANLMRVHIQLSQTQKPRIAGRGVPPAFKLVSR